MNEVLLEADRLTELGNPLGQVLRFSRTTIETHDANWSYYEGCDEGDGYCGYGDGDGYGNGYVNYGYKNENGNGYGDGDGYGYGNGGDGMGFGYGYGYGCGRGLIT